MPRKPKQEDILKQLATGRDFSALGRTGLSHFAGLIGEEFLPSLQGQQGIKRYDEMRKNDPVVGAMLFTIESMIHNVSISIKAADSSDEEERKRWLVESSLLDMTRSWRNVLSDILTFLPFGWSYLETIYKRRQGFNRDPRKSSRYSDGLIGWRDLSLRGQNSLLRWEIDDEDHLLGMVQLPEPDFKQRFIPAEKALHFVIGGEKGNPEGVSVLRNSVRPYLIKKKLEVVEAIAVERDLTGLPVIKTPEGVDIWNPNDPNAATLRERLETLIRSIRRDEHEGIVLPGGFEFSLTASIGNRPIDTSKIISRWDQRMAMTILTDMILIGTERVGSFALVTAKANLFSKSLRGFLQVIEDEMNRVAIPRLMRINGFDTEKVPKFVFGPIETPSLKEISDFLKSWVDLQLPVDEDLEQFLRGVANFPTKKTPKGEALDAVPAGEGEEESELEARPAEGAPKIIQPEPSARG